MMEKGQDQIPDEGILITKIPRYFIVSVDKILLCFIGVLLLWRTLTLTLILKNGKMLKKDPQKKKQIKKTKLLLQLFLMANFDRVTNGPIDMRVWKGR
jgi:hypothetical protein